MLRAGPQMFQISINEKGGQPRSMDFDKAEITVGRVQGNDIVLPKGNISKRHSRLVVKDGKFIIMDLQSTNGTYVNGKKIAQPQVVKASDKIYIGDFTLQILTGGADAKAPRGPSPAEEGEVELFGGPKDDGRAPGLIDDNFDQEFDGPAAEPAPVAKPAPVAAKPAAKKRPEPEIELEIERGGDDGGLDLDPGPDPDLAFEAPKPKAAPAPASAPKREPKAPEPKPAPAAPRPSVSRAKPVAPATTSARAKADDDDVHAPPSAGPSPAPSAIVAATVAPATAASMTAVPSMVTGGASALPASAPGAPIFVSGGPSVPPLARREAIESAAAELADALGLRGRALAELDALRGEAEAAAARWLDALRSSGRLVSGGFDGLARAIADELTEVEFVADLLEDESVHEVLISGGEVFAEREGQLSSADRRFPREDAVVGLVRRLARLAGDEHGLASGFVDVRLRDGARLVATLPPVAFRGPIVSIRKPSREAFVLDNLVEHGALSAEMSRFVDYCVRYRRGVLLAVGPGVTASATLNAVAALVPVDERVVTIESGVEIYPRQTQAIALEPRPGQSVGGLLRQAAAFQPGRVVSGLLSAGDVHDAATLGAGPLEGLIACTQASSAAQALDRLAESVLANVGSLDEARKLVARAFPVVLVESRFADLSRRLTEMAELVVDPEGVRVETVFHFELEAGGGGEFVAGQFKATGYVPRFLEELHDGGLEVNKDIFQAP
jgi:pilus assembly protein CpaF